MSKSGSTGGRENTRGSIAAFTLFCFLLSLTGLSSTLGEELEGAAVECPVGFRALEGQCTDIDECGEKISSCDLTRARCIDNIGSFVCQCNPGFVEDDASCSDDSFSAQTTILFAASRSVFVSSWTTVNQVYSNVATSGTNLLTEESKALAATAFYDAREYGSWGTLVTIHALFLQEEAAQTAKQRLGQFLDLEHTFTALTSINSSIALPTEVAEYQMSRFGSTVQIDSSGLGLSVENISFDFACGCWTIDVSYSRPVGVAVVLYLPRIEGIIPEFGPLEYPHDVRASMEPNTFPCQYSGSFDRKTSPCCLYDVQDEYRTTEAFDGWLASAREMQEEACDEGAEDSPPPTAVPPNGHFVEGTPSGMPRSRIVALDSAPNSRRYRAQLKLDEHELWMLGGITTHPPGVSRRVETFVGMVGMFPLGPVLDSQAEQVGLTLDKSDYFMVSFSGLGAVAEEEQVIPAERRSSWNAEMRLTNREECMQEEELREEIARKVKQQSEAAASPLQAVEVQEFSVRRVSGSCNGNGLGIGANGNGVRAVGGNRGKRGSKKAGWVSGIEGKLREAIEERTVSAAEELSLSEGTFVIELVFAVDGGRINLDRMLELSTLISLDPINKPAAIVIDNYFEPKLVAPPAQPVQSAEINAGDGPAPEALGAGGAGEGKGGGWGLDAILMSVVAGVVVLVLLVGGMFVWRRRKRSHGVIRLPAGTRRSSAMRLAANADGGQVRKASSAMGLAANTDGGEERRASIVAMNSIGTGAETRIMVAEPTRRGSSSFSHFCNTGKLESGESGLMESPASNGRRSSLLNASLLNALPSSSLRSSLLSNLGRTARLAASSGSRPSGFGNRRGSTQVIALAADVLPTGATTGAAQQEARQQAAFQELGADAFARPSVFLEPGMSMSFRPKMEPGISMSFRPKK